MTDICCPACHGSQVDPVMTVSVDQAAQHFVLKQELPERHSELAAHIRKLWQQESCCVKSCAACGSGFVDPFIGGDARFYNLAYPRVEHPTMKWEFRRTGLALRGRDTAGRLALEVGAGNGSFLDLVCPGMFLPANVVALEYNTVAVQRLRAKGYTAIPCDLRDVALDAYHGCLDYIFAFQVLEHMDRLDEVFDRLNQLAKTNASVFLAVPNKNRTDYQESNGSLLDMPPNHIGRWTPQALEALGNRHGFVTEAQETEPFNPKEFLRHDLIYSYLRKAQTGGSTANRIRSLPVGLRRRMLEMAFAAAGVPWRLRAWRNAYTKPEMGASIWVNMRKL